MFGNVNVDYKPCKSKAQLERAADYILGRQPEQIRDGVIKTAPNLYWGMNCDRDNFARDVLMTRKLFGKRETGKAYRRNQKDLYDMCEFFGEQCQQRGLTNSVRQDFYNHHINASPDKEKVGEHRMKANGKETFKDELREVIQIELADPNNHTLEDVVNALMKHYNVECRIKGNTISYRHPNFTDKSGKLA